MSNVVVETPGKVNLVLDVRARRPDGYHEISSLMMAVSLYDRLEVEDRDDGRIELVCDAPGVPLDESNLVVQAALKLRHLAGVTRGCRISLQKSIPVGGGMGGGSSDAAAALVALNAVWRLGLGDMELSDLGAAIGSDVPFFLATPSAIVTGRGDCVRAADLRWHGCVVLVVCGVHVSTKDVYARCIPSGRDSRRGGLDDLLRVAGASELRDLLRNDLEPAVCETAPRVRDVRDALAEMGASSMRISGAGSVLFDLFDGRGEAEELASRIKAGVEGVSVTVVEAPARVRMSEGEHSHGNQRCSNQVDRQR